MATAVKESFEHAVEEAEQVLGLEPTSIQREEALAKFRGLPFWIWDKKSHQKRFDETSIDGGITGRCCYNHVLSLPSKLGVTHPLYASYQKSVIDGLIQHRRIAVAKPRSAGISELLLRWAEYIALRDDSLKGHQIIIISAPSQNLSLSFLRRIRAHLEPHLGPFTTNQNVIQVGGVRYEVLPSHNLRTLRGRDRIGMVIIEESDFWNKNEEDELLPIVLPFIQKSNPYLAMVSTPGRKGSLMERMFTEDLQTNEEEAKQYSLFHKIRIKFEDVELYSEEDRRLARLQPNFRREFGGEWGFGTGSLFLSADLEKCVELGRRYADVRYNPDHAKRPYPHSIYPEADCMIGVDTAGGSSSQFAICGLQIWNKHLHVFAAETYTRPNTDRMIDRILELWQGTGYSGTVYVDGSNPGFVRTLKQNMGRGECTDFEDHIQYLRKHGYAGNQDIHLSDYMKCVPVYFNVHAARLLQTASLYVQRHLLALHPDFKELLASMHSARTREHAAHDWALDKSQFPHDILDAFRCGLYDLRIEKPKVMVKQ